MRIDTAPIPGDPAATVRKMAQVRRAALAPLQPSSTDRAIAQQASSNAAQARQDLAATGGQSAEEATQEEEATAQAEASRGSEQDQQASEKANQALSTSRLFAGLFG